MGDITSPNLHRVPAVAPRIHAEEASRGAAEDAATWELIRAEEARSAKKEAASTERPAKSTKSPQKKSTAGKKPAKRIINRGASRRATVTSQTTRTVIELIPRPHTTEVAVASAGLLLFLAARAPPSRPF